MRDLLSGGSALLLLGVVAALPVQARDPVWDQLRWEERLGVSWYQRLAERGDAEAQLRLGLLLERGIDGEPDIIEAQRWYRAAAEQGHPRAQFLLARLLQQEDPEAAVNWFAAAAEAGIPEAAFNLALMKENGLGVELDLDAAAALYEQAFAEGLGNAALNRGLLALKGSDPDPVTALAWLLRAQAAGVPEAAQAAEAIASGLSEEERKRAAAQAAE